MTAQLFPIDCAPKAGDDLRELLDDLIAMHAKGELSSVAVAVVYRTGATSVGYSTAPSYATLIGGVARLQHKLLRVMEDI